MEERDRNGKTKRETESKAAILRQVSNERLLCLHHSPLTYKYCFRQKRLLFLKKVMLLIFFSRFQLLAFIVLFLLNCVAKNKKSASH